MASGPTLWWRSPRLSLPLYRWANYPIKPGCSDSRAFARSRTSWLYGIAIRLASEHRRRAHVRREIPTLEPALHDQEIPCLDAFEKSELRHVFNVALEQLDDDKRAVFVLYELEEFDMKEIAAAVGCPIQTAYSRLHSARLRVAESIRAQHPDWSEGGEHEK